MLKLQVLVRDLDIEKRVQGASLTMFQPPSSLV